MTTATWRHFEPTLKPPCPPCDSLSSSKFVRQRGCRYAPGYFPPGKEKDQALALEASYALSNVSSLTITWRTWSSFFIRAETALHACNTVP
jgi:hypothetical protein